jgi:hypothetical protein
MDNVNDRIWIMLIKILAIPDNNGTKIDVSLAKTVFL